MGQRGLKGLVTASTARISVLMAARNASATLPACLESLRAQRFADYELIVMDDGSNDETPAILSAAARDDQRVRVFSRPPTGLVPLLNEGTRHATSPYLARMDADDVMAPNRLALQYEHLQAHRGVDAVASTVRAFPPAVVAGGMRRYLAWQNGCVSAHDIAQEIFIEATVTQPSVALRKQSLLEVGGYRDGDFPEDYELWLRMLARGMRIEKIDEVLLHWRQRRDSYSKTDARFSRAAFDGLRARYLARHLRDVLGGDQGRGRALVVWGAGRKTRRRCEHLLAHGLTIAGWIDIDPRKIGRDIAGVPVRGPDALAVRPRPFVLVYVAVHGARAQIAERLHALGFARARDYLCVG